MEQAHTVDVGARYSTFAAKETPQHSAVMHAWSAGVAGDPEICALIQTLPPRERQPNLVLAAARWVDPGLVDPGQVDPRPDEYARLRRVLVERWDDIAAITATRHTQTNEAGRLAVVLPALAQIAAAHPGRGLALIELGASAGLALHPHGWRFRYLSRAGATISEFGEPSRPVIEVTVKDHRDRPHPDELPSLPLSTGLPPIQWRLGLDLTPLNPARPADAAWLRTLVWPGQVQRLERLDHALRAAIDDPVLVLTKDITDPDMLEEILALVPRDLVPVVMHSAVMAYLTEDQREALGQRLQARVGTDDLHWVSNEGSAVVPQVGRALAARPAFAQRLRPGAFVVAVDGLPQYQADGHASWVL